MEKELERYAAAMRHMVAAGFDEKDVFRMLNEQARREGLDFEVWDGRYCLVCPVPYFIDEVKP